MPVTGLLFVDRIQELKFIESILDDISNNRRSEYRIIDFFGVGGIGKSTLLRKIALTFQENKVTYSSIDFLRGEYRYQHADLKVFLDVLTDIVGFVPDDIEQEVTLFWEILTERILDAGAFYHPQKILIFNKIYEAVLAHINKSPTNTFCLVFDTIELASSDCFSSIEFYLIGPLLANSSNVIALLAGRSFTELKQVFVKRARIPMRLPPFSPIDSIAQLRVEGLENKDVAEKVHKITSGYPQANKYLLTAIKNLNISIDKEMIEKLANHLIPNYVIGKENLDILPTLETLSVIRRFDLNLLREMVFNDSVAGLSEEFELLKKLVKAKMVFEENGSYLVEYPVRRILSKSLELNSPKRFFELHTRARNFILTELRLTPDQFKPPYIAELLYHTLCIRNAATFSQPSDVDNFFQAFKEVSWKRKDSQFAALIALEDLFSNDLEIEEILNNDLGKIIQVIRKRREEILGSYRQDDTKSIRMEIERLPSGEYKIGYKESRNPTGIMKVLLIDKALRDDVQGSIENLTRLYNQLEVNDQREISDIRLREISQELKSLGEVIFGLFMPTEIQKQLLNLTPDINLVIESNDHEIPFEIMHDGRDYIGLQYNIGRVLESGSQQPKYNVSREKIIKALLIGDPNGDLPEARKELERIADSLSGIENIQVTSLIGHEANLLEVMKALRTGNYDIIHFACHAFFDDARPADSGLICSDGQILRCDHIERLLVGSPIVFLNACQSAKHSSGYVPYLGAHSEGLAASFLRAGAFACIGSLWPVFDNAAADFSCEFYMSLIQGNLPIGAILRKCRSKVLKEYPLNAAWSSFVLYGDPSMKPLQRAFDFE